MTLLAFGLLAFLWLLYGLDRLLSRRAIRREFRQMERELAAMQMANEPRPSSRRPLY